MTMPWRIILKIDFDFNLWIFLYLKKVYLEINPDFMTTV